MDKDDDIDERHVDALYNMDHQGDRGTLLMHN